MVTATGNTVEKVTVTGAYNVGGMFGQAQNATVDGNTVKNVTVTSTTASSTSNLLFNENLIILFSIAVIFNGHDLHADREPLHPVKV